MQAPGRADADAGLSAASPWALRGPGWITHALTAFVAVATLAFFSVPCGYFFLFLAVLMGWSVLGLLWFSRAVIFVVARVRRRGEVLPPARLLPWTVAPVAFAVLAVLGPANVPLYVVFRLSRPALERSVEAVLAAPDDYPPDPIGPGERVTWIGLYPVEKIEHVPGGARFRIAWTGWLDRCGFAYSPDGPPPNLGGEDRYSDFSGDWYLWEESW